MWNPFRRKKREPETGEVLEEGEIEFGYAEPTHEEAEEAYRQEVREELEEKEAQQKARERYLEELHEAQAKAEAERKAREKAEAQARREERQEELVEEWKELDIRQKEAAMAEEEAGVARREAKARQLEAEYPTTTRGKALKALRSTGSTMGKGAKWFAEGFLVGGTSDRYGRRGRRRRTAGYGSRVGRAIRKVATMGGPVRLSKTTERYYVPRANKALYDVSGMRQLTMLHGVSGTNLEGLRQLQMGGLGHLRIMPTMPRAMPAVSIGSSGQGLGLEPGERIIKEWEYQVYFPKDGHSVVGENVVLTRLPGGQYAFRGTDKSDMTPLFRFIGSNPPAEKSYGPTKRKGK